MRAIDSSALIKYFSREEGWDRVRDLMRDGVITLDLAVKEIANALWKKVVRGEMEYRVAAEILRDIVEGKPFPIEKQDIYILEAFKIACENGITIYDSLFIALAKAKNLEIITSDSRQAETARKIGVKALLV